MDNRISEPAPVSIPVELPGDQLQQPAGKRTWVTPDLKVISRDVVGGFKTQTYSETSVPGHLPYNHISGYAS